MKRENSNAKRELREYYVNNARGYVCHLCHRLGGTLFKVGRDKDGCKVYRCERCPANV